MESYIPSAPASIPNPAVLAPTSRSQSGLYQTADIRHHALQALDLGLSTIPPTCDGVKRPWPGGPDWKAYQERLPSRDELARWYGTNGHPLTTGIGLVCGSVSGRAQGGSVALVALDFDRREAYVEFVELARRVGLGSLVEFIESGYCEDTPSGGVHWLAYVEMVGGETYPCEKLAERPDPAVTNGRKTLIEVKGEGGFLIVAPTYGAVHPTGKPYVLRAGSLATIPTLTRAEWQDLCSVARALDEMPPEVEEEPKPRRKPQVACDGVIDAGTDFTQRASWGEVLTPHGWTLAYTRGSTAYWTRPDKPCGVSATTGHTEADTLAVFSTSTPFKTVTDGARTTYTKFAAYALLNHGSSFSEATKALSNRGYGTFATWVKAGDGWKLDIRPNPCPKGVRVAKPGEGPPVEINDPWKKGGPASVPSPLTDESSDPIDPAELTDEELGLTDMHTVQARDVEWLWKERIAEGKLTLIAGEKGAGKSFFTLALASIVSRGAVFPDRPTEPVKQAHVILVGAEDDLEDTVKPRLDAMGADSRRITAVGIGKDRKGRAVYFTVADLWHLEGIMKRRPETKLIIIDPITQYLGPINDHRNTELRAVLMPLAEFAKKHHVAVVLITHFNKGSGGKVMSRIIGSTAYTAVVRSVFAVAVDPEDENRRLFMPITSNLKFDRTSIAYSIVDGAVQWEDGTVKIDPSDIVGSEAGGKQDRRKKASAWLRETLAAGPLPSEEVLERGKAAGFGRDLIWEVKGSAGVRAQKNGLRGWVWTCAEPPAVIEWPVAGSA